MEPALLVKTNFHLAMDNVFQPKNQLDQSTWTVRLKMEMELVQSAENTTNLLTDNALHSTKIQNVKSGVKKKFVNAVTIQTSTTLITTIFAQRKNLTALK